MDDELKLVERLRQKAIDLRLGDYYRSGGVGKSAVVADEKARILDEAAAAITRLHAEIEALKSDVSDLVRAGSDEATENERLREALRPFAAIHAESIKDFGIDFPQDKTPRPDDRPAWGFNAATLTWGHFRAASRTLEGGEG